MTFFIPYLIVTIANTVPMLSSNLSTNERPIVLNAVGSPGNAARAIPLPALTKRCTLDNYPLT